MKRITSGVDSAATKATIVEFSLKGDPHRERRRSDANQRTASEVQKTARAIRSATQLAGANVDP
jgi:hypothetical protein